MTDLERTELLRLARAAIAAALGLGETPDLALESTALREECGAFVTIYVDARLHGCVGTVGRRDPLYLTVIRVAGAAALHDPRFPSLSVSEARRMQIEISRLTPLRPVRADEVDPRRHGVCVARGESRGLLLPQVATRYGWDRQRLLEETCRKAGVRADAWRDPEVHLFVFEAEVFGDVPGE